MAWHRQIILDPEVNLTEGVLAIVLPTVMHLVVCDSLPLSLPLSLPYAVCQSTPNRECAQRKSRGILGCIESH